jgi:hypothetical protein
MKYIWLNQVTDIVTSMIKQQITMLLKHISLNYTAILHTKLYYCKQLKSQNMLETSQDLSYFLSCFDVSD